MKKLIIYPSIMLLALVALFTSCKKDATTKASTSTAGVASTGTISLGVFATTSSNSTTTKDTLMLVNYFGPKSKPDSVAFSALPAVIRTYLTSNYSGYISRKHLQ